MSIVIRFEIHIHVSKSGGEKSKFTSTADSPDKRWFFQLATQEIGQLESSLSRSTIDNYKTALRMFRLYLEHDVEISNISQQLFKGFERWLKDRHVCLNSSSNYMRSLKALINRIKPGNNSLLFEGIYTGRAKTVKRAISESDLQKIKKVELRPHTFLSLVRDLFLFSFYAFGMPFVDMAFLRRSQIKDNQLVYYRHKTGQRVAVALEPCMHEIINRYNSDSEYIFPLLQSAEPQKAYQEYLQKLNRYNRTLKTLAKKAGLSLRLTSYTTRHTWASVAYSSNLDLPVISKGLGHTNTQTTLTYIKEINDERLTEANRHIIAKI